MKPPLKSTIKVQEKIRALLLPWARSSAIFYSFFVSPPSLNTPPSLVFFPPSLLLWHSRSSSVRLLEWMMESCVVA